MALELAVRTVGGLLQFTVLGVVALETWRVHGPGRPRRFGSGSVWLESRRFPPGLSETEERFRLLSAQVEELRTAIDGLRGTQQVSDWRNRRNVAVRPWQLPVILLGISGTTWPSEIAHLLEALVPG